MFLLTEILLVELCFCNLFLFFMANLDLLFVMHDCDAQI